MLLAGQDVSVKAWKMRNAACKQMMQTCTSQRQTSEHVGWRRCYLDVHFSQPSLPCKALRCDFQQALRLNRHIEAGMVVWQRCNISYAINLKKLEVRQRNSNDYVR